MQLTLAFQLKPITKVRSKKTPTEMLVDVKGAAPAKDETIQFSVGFYSPDSEMCINTGPVDLESVGGIASGEAKTTLFMPDTPGDKEFWIQLFQLGRLVYARRIEVRVEEAKSHRIR